MPAITRCQGTGSSHSRRPPASQACVSATHAAGAQGNGAVLPVSGASGFFRIACCRSTECRTPSTTTRDTCGAHVHDKRAAVRRAADSLCAMGGERAQADRREAGSGRGWVWVGGWGRLAGALGFHGRAPSPHLADSPGAGLQRRRHLPRRENVMLSNASTHGQPIIETRERLMCVCSALSRPDCVEARGRLKTGWAAPRRRWRPCPPGWSAPGRNTAPGRLSVASSPPSPARVQSTG